LVSVRSLRTASIAEGFEGGKLIGFEYAKLLDELPGLTSYCRVHKMTKLGSGFVVLAMLIACSPSQTESQQAEDEPDAGQIAYDSGDYELAFSEWSALAEQGNASAQYNLGVMYDNGDGVAQFDNKEAVKWYRKAAEQGNASAQFSLGFMYAYGQGVVQDYKEALKWYRKAAKQGNASAQFNLGGMYVSGDGVAQDFKEAVKWFRKAAEQGNASAQFRLGLMYDLGKGVVQDYKEAVKWYRKAAEQGVASAQFNLGEMYAYGDGVAQDFKEAVKWYRKAAEQGHDAAANAVLGDDDLSKMTDTYDANKLRFKKNYAGTLFSSEMSFRTVKTAIDFVNDAYQVEFGLSGFTSDVDCKVMKQSTLDAIAEWNKADVISVTGIVDDVSFGSIQLIDCSFSRASKN